MDFDDIFISLTHRVQMTDTEAIDIIIDAHLKGAIDEEEKELLLNLV